MTVDLTKLKVGDKIKHRCGELATVLSIELKPIELHYFPIIIVTQGHGTESFTVCGDYTALPGKSTWDIIEIIPQRDIEKQMGDNMKNLLKDNSDLFDKLAELEEKEKLEQPKFLRYDTGKFKTITSEIGLILTIINQFYLPKPNKSISLIDIAIQFQEFKEDPSKNRLSTLIDWYLHYINSIDLEKPQTLKGTVEVKHFSGIDEVFSLMYVTHTTASNAGAIKYGLRNWKNMQPNEVVRCVEPCERHMVYYPIVKGEIVDSENGLPHYMPTLWNLIAIYRVMLINEEETCKAILKG